MATSLHAVTLANLDQGSRVVIIGAGPIGLGATFFARRANTRRLVTVARSDRHRHLAMAMGADDFVAQGSDIDEKLIKALGGRPDVVLELSGAQGVIGQAIDWVRPAGTIVAAGASSPVYDQVMHSVAVGKEIRLQYAASYLREDFRIIADIFASGDTQLRQLISRRISLDEFPTLFENLRTSHGECKVMVDPAL
jgi:(R,R)-butanediol dehydrogenase/meso-butanediol dehydrogenase/diacetyl reductase